MSREAELRAEIQRLHAAMEDARRRGLLHRTQSETAFAEAYSLGRKADGLQKNLRGEIRRGGSAVKSPDSRFAATQTNRGGLGDVPVPRNCTTGLESGKAEVLR